MLVEVVLWAIALVILVQGTLVAFRSSHSGQGVFFILTTICGAAWSVGLAFFLSGDNINQLVLATKIYYVAAAGLAWAMLAFACYATKIKWRHLIAMIAIIPLLMVATRILFMYPTFITDLHIGPPNTAELDVLNYSQYAVYFIVYSLLSVVFLLRGVTHSISSIEKKRTAYILVAYVTALLFGTFFNLILPWLGDYQLVWIGPISVVIFAFIIQAAITRYRLFNMRLFIVRLMSWVAIMIVMGITCFILLSVIHNGKVDTQTAILETVCFVVLSVIFYIVVRRLVNSSNQFFVNALVSGKLFDDISRIAIDNVDIQKMLDRITRTIVRSSKSSYALICMNVANKELVSRAQGSEINPKDLDAILTALKKRKTGVLVTEEIDNNNPVYGVLVSNNVSVVAILRDNDTHQIVGMLIIGQEKPTLYSDREIAALSAICDVIVIAVRNSELSMLDKTKDEFMSIASHQLRTPLTSIQGYASMILDGDFGATNKEQTHALNEVVTSSRRMAVLIDDLLNVSRLQSGKFIISRVATNIGQLVREEIDQAKLMASAHGVKLVYDDEKWDEIPEISVDQAKVGEVMANLIDNAIFYSHHDSTVEISLAKTASDVEFKVKDRGIGVPKKDQVDLFTKFFRASNARTIRPDGTGIGLFLAQKVIKEHNGEIVFSSVEGKGSTFGFRLPIK